MDTHPDYTADWRDYRRRRLIFWVTFLGFIPGVFILFTVIALPMSLVSDIEPGYFFLLDCWPLDAHVHDCQFSILVVLLPTLSQKVFRNILVSQSTH